MSVDKSARSTAADVLQLDLFGALDAIDEPINTITCDDAFAAFQADLDAFDALIGSSELLLHSAVARETVVDSEQPIDAKGATEDCTSDDKPSSDASSSSTGGGDASPTAKKSKCAPGGNAARKRQRDEVHALRESTVLLEKELRTLQAIAKRSSSLLHTKESIPLLPYSTNATLLAHEDQARQLAELENSQLIKLVNDHIAVAKRFKKSLFKRPPSMSSEIFLETTPSSLKAAGMASEPHTVNCLRVFEALGKNIDTQHHELERVFRAAGLTNCRTNMVETRVDMDRENGGVATLRFKMAHLFPFSMQAITAMMLKNVGKRHGSEHMKWRSEPFNKEFQSGDTTVTMRNVGKRHSENGRIVVVWEGLSEWLDKESGEIVTFQEKGWSVIQPYTQSSSAKKRQQQQQDVSSVPLSLMQSYSCMTPVKNGAAKRKESRVSMRHLAILANVVKPLYEEQVAVRIQDLENALLDESLKQRLMAS